ncbi:dihydroorotate dehydrogenase-like protein [Chitinispirillales bacterium ANBcel5]|uniref:dihydroorotate dehydrogenase-like protein n=1 Tax=Cellulosispirillum alkaliphilum TaxID=3039283 RepID=UPI002A53D804|nr:dihydroorotate dehydrogenase-like protein [Chitinispirillales bacterium ANBcel5]
MDLSTNYMGLTLKNPLIGSSSPIWSDESNVKRFEQAGGAAIVLYSLFEEQVVLDEKSKKNAAYADKDDVESFTYLPDFGHYSFSPQQYLDFIDKVKKSTTIPIIASLNGTTAGEWTHYASEIEECGADGLELNIYSIADDPLLSAPSVEESYLELIRIIRKSIKIPFAVKMSPYFSSVPNMVKRIRDTGVDGIVLFNRLYEPDINLKTLDVLPALRLSSSEDLKMRLRWASILFDKVAIDIGISGGVHTAQDVIKSKVAGAKAVMMTSRLLKGDIEGVKDILAEISSWLDRNGYSSLGEIEGMLSELTVDHLRHFRRAEYLRVLGNYREWIKRQEG